MEYERLLKILRTISDLNENNIIERVKEELEKEDPDTYKKWQDNGFNINYTFDDQSTLLHIAARNDLVKIAELLIKKGVMLIQQIKMDGILYTLLLQVAV